LNELFELACVDFSKAGSSVFPVVQDDVDDSVLQQLKQRVSRLMFIEKLRAEVGDFLDSFDS
jgi:hypothetical protein